jgi:orotate phosphoribosyltransferase-like protein
MTEIEKLRQEIIKLRSRGLTRKNMIKDEFNRGKKTKQIAWDFGVSIPTVDGIRRSMK